MSDTLHALARALDAAAADAAPALLGGEPTQRSARTWRWGSRGSLAVEIAGPKAGRWFDHEAGTGGDLLALARRQHGGDLRAAIDWARGFLRLPEQREPPRPAPRPAPARVENGPSWSRQLARTLWREAVPVAGTLAEAYLASRGLRPEPPAPLRFHPAAWRNPANGPHGPVMLALMTDAASNQAVGIHVTYLRPCGRGKADGPSPKVMLGGAGVVRLVPDAAVTLGLGLSEGIETGLAVMQRADWRPVWAAASAGGMARFPVLDGIEALTLFCDADDRGAGLAAAETCAARWRAAGLEARIMAPPAGADWRDALAGRAA